MKGEGKGLDLHELKNVVRGSFGSAAAPKDSCRDGEESPLDYSDADWDRDVGHGGMSYAC